MCLKDVQQEAFRESTPRANTNPENMSKPGINCRKPQLQGKLGVFYLAICMYGKQTHCLKPKKAKRTCAYELHVHHVYHTPTCKVLCAIGNCFSNRTPPQTKPLWIATPIGYWSSNHQCNDDESTLSRLDLCNRLCACVCVWAWIWVYVYMYIYM